MLRFVLIYACATDSPLVPDPYGPLPGVVIPVRPGFGRLGAAGSRIAPEPERARRRRLLTHGGVLLLAAIAGYVATRLIVDTGKRRCDGGCGVAAEWGRAGGAASLLGGVSLVSLGLRGFLVPRKATR